MDWNEWTFGDGETIKLTTHEQEVEFDRRLTVAVKSDGLCTMIDCPNEDVYLWEGSQIPVCFDCYREDYAFRCGMQLWMKKLAEKLWAESTNPVRAKA